MPTSITPRLSPGFPAGFNQTTAVSSGLMRPLPSPPSPIEAVSRLGTQTKVQMNGNVLFNEPLVRQIIVFREAALPPLKNYLLAVDNIPGLLEALYTIGKLADGGVGDLQSLTSAIARWNSHPDPLVQMHLARVYRKINDPKTFGPMLSTLVNQAVNRYAALSTPNYNISAETGQTVLDLLANRVADILTQRLGLSNPPNGVPSGPRHGLPNRF